MTEQVSTFLKLSATDIFIINYLSAYPEPARRKELLETLRELIDSTDAISTSTFYNRINKLIELDLIKETAHSKILITEKGIEAASRLHKLSMIRYSNFQESIDTLLPKFIEESGIRPQDREKILIIDLEKGLSLKKIHLVAQFARIPFILADNDTFQRYKNNLQPMEIHQTDMLEGRIREADQFYDATVILGFSNVGKAKDSDMWLNEAKRVTKANGLVVIVSLEKLQTIDHILMNEFCSEIERSDFCKCTDIAMLKEHLKTLNFEDIKDYRYSGIIITVAKVPL